ncbi:hypothetical protein PIB30_089408 [Stylosanthes scabra]|uniref:Uncharacterized protein n=1 Tax=Stylosanthes scabra TaxID=79078 RepID=A0ABU6WXJ5_9FABA|nr:hypothetical protein [Stylosanthes scabra]
MEDLYVRDILPCSIKMLIKEHLHLSYIDEGVPFLTHSLSRRRSGRLNQPTESSHDSDSGETTDEEYRSYLTMIGRRHNETSDDERKCDGLREVINLSDDSESSKDVSTEDSYSSADSYVPVALGEELGLFGRRSMWRVVGPGTVINNIFTFLAINQSRNEDEFHLSLGW